MQNPFSESATPSRVSRALLCNTGFALLLFWALAALVLIRAKALGFAIALFGSGPQGPLHAGFDYARDDRRQ